LRLALHRDSHAVSLSHQKTISGLAAPSPLHISFIDEPSLTDVDRPSSPPSDIPPSRQPARPWRSLLVIAGVAAALLVLRRSSAALDVMRLVGTWRAAPLAPLYFLLLSVPYSAVGLPRQALCMAAGMVFGLPEGLALSTIGTLAGNCMSYGWAYHSRHSSQPSALQARLGNRFAGFSRFLGQAPFPAVLAARLMPIGSAVLVSIAAGLLKIPFIPFAAATLIGGLPQNLVFVLIGSGVRIGATFQVALGLALFALSIALGLFLLRRSHKQGKVAESDCQKTD